MKRKASTAINRPFKRPRQVAQPQVYKKKSAPSIGVEKKFNDFSAITDISTTGTVTDITTFAAGDTALLRDGNKVLCKSIQLRGTLTLESLGKNAIVRYMVIHDKNANGVAPTWAQVVSTTPTTSHVASLKSITNASRFTTLLDRTIVLNNQSDTAGAVAKAYINDYINIPANCQLASFADGSAVVPTSGSLSLMMISDVASGIDDVDCLVLGRLRFIG